MNTLTKIKRFALALCLATPLVLRADAITVVNPVTGETETYANKYTGTNGSWNEAENWDTGSIPYVSGGVYTSALVDGGGTETVVTGTSIDGWAMKLGVYGGAKVTISGLAKWTGGNGADYATVDSSSKLTITSMDANNWNHVVNYYVASPGGITYTCAFAPANDAATIQYNLAGNGSVVYESTVNKAGHLIKAADVTLSGTSQVSSKTLVSFSSTTKTFTAAADIKVYDGSTLKETVGVTSVRSAGTAIADTSSMLTTSDAVGSCEIVQCTDGIVLYYVDGDPSSIVAKTYKPSISVNFCHGNAPLTTAADVGVGDYAVPGTSWNNMISAGGNDGTFSTPLTTIYKIDSTGATSLISGASVAVSGTRGSWNKGNVTAGSDVRNGYIDDNASNASPQFVVEGIPYYSYKIIIYFASDNNDTKFGYVTVNGENYKGDLDNTATVAAEVGDIWGAASDTSFTEGGNYLVIPTQVNTDGTLTVVSHRLTGCRAGLAAVQIIEVPKTAEEGELVINVSGDTTYTVSENATYTTVYVTGAGTLAFSGEGTITTTTLNIGPGATVPMGSSITPTTVVGAGTVVYDGAQPSTTLGFDDSASWFGTVWVKNIGTSPAGETANTAVTLGADTNTAADNTINLWGNVNSCVKFTNVRGHVAASDCPWTLILEDDGDKYAWYNNNGWTAQNKDPVFAKLTGEGTFYDQANIGCRQNVTFTDATEFSGTFTVAGKRIGLGGVNTAQNNEAYRGTIEVVSGAAATIASGKTWTTGTGFRINGTLNVNGTLAAESTATTCVTGSGTVVFTGRAPTPTGDTWWKNSAWTGTVQMKNVTDLVGASSYTGTNFLPVDYGNTGSVLELYNCSGWLPNNSNYQCTVPLKITGTLTINNGISGSKFVISSLSGRGTIYTSSNSATITLQVLEASGFTGKVQLNSKRVVFGETLPSEYTVGNIYVGEGFSFTVPNSDVAWYGTGGITLAGELKAAALSNFGGGTTITTTDTGVFTLVSNSNTDDLNVDYTRIQGTGTLKYEGTNYRTISTNNFPTAMTVENNLSNGLIHRIPNLEVTIGSLSGSGQMRSDWGGSGSTGDRDLRILQANDTTYSGLFASTNDRIDEVYVAPGASTAGTLTLSGAQTASNGLIVETGASVNLTGTWVGATTVAGTFGGTGTLTGDLTFSDGATFKAFASDSDGLAVSGTITYPETGTVTVELAEVPVVDTVLITASGLDATKFELASGTDGSLKVEDDTLVYVAPYVTITVPTVANATVAVTVGGVAVLPITEGGNTYQVEAGSVVTVTYAAESGYAISGTTQYTIDTTTETTFEITDTATAQYVARVRNYGTNQNEDFTSLNAAIAVADGTTYANSITLLADITDAVTIDKAISLAGQGRTISAAVTISSGGYLSLMGPTLAGKLTIGANGAFAVTGTGSVLPEVETQDGASIALRTLSADTVALTVTTLTVNGTLTLSSTAQGTVRGTPYKAFSYVTANATFGEGAEIVGDGEYSASTEDEGDNTVVSMTITAVAKIGDEYYDDLDEAVADAIANDTVVDLLIQPAAAVTLGVGQTLKVKAYSYTLEVNLASGLTNPPYSISSALNIDTTITTYTVNVAFAKIGNTTYPTLAAAIAAATSGQTVKLLADTDGVVGANANDITLDLAGFTVTGGDAIKWTGSGKLTIVDSVGGGKAIATDAEGCAIWVTGGSVEVQAGYFQNSSDGEATVYVGVAGASATITGGTFKNTVQDYKWAGSDFDYYCLNVGNVLPATSIQVSGGSFSHDPAKGDDKLGSLLAEGYVSEKSGDFWVVSQYVPPSGIDPTKPNSTQEVTVDTSLTAEEQEAAAIAAATVAIPAGVSGVDAATYKTYFTYSATPTATAGTYDVAITGFADEVTETADGNALSALEAATAGTALGSITVKPGLYYGTAAGADVTTLKAPAGTLNTTGTLDLSGVTKPSTGEAYFIKIKVGTTAFTAEE